MAMDVYQFRYYGEEDTRNYPSGLNATELKNGNVFNEYAPIIQLGIQALPGTKFDLNNSEEQIVIGNTGIYELELDAQVAITALRFNNSSLKTISDNTNAVLIIDIIYGEEE